MGRLSEGSDEGNEEYEGKKINNVQSLLTEEKEDPKLIFKHLADIFSKEDLKNPDAKNLFSKARDFFGL